MIDWFSRVLSVTTLCTLLCSVYRIIILFILFLFFQLSLLLPLLLFVQLILLLFHLLLCHLQVVWCDQVWVLLNDKPEVKAYDGNNGDSNTRQHIPCKLCLCFSLFFSSVMLLRFLFFLLVAIATSWKLVDVIASCQVQLLWNLFFNLWFFSFGWFFFLDFKIVEGAAWKTKRWNLVVVDFWNCKVAFNIVLKGRHFLPVLPGECGRCLPVIWMHHIYFNY